MTLALTRENRHDAIVPENFAQYDHSRIPLTALPVRRPYAFAGAAAAIAARHRSSLSHKFIAKYFAFENPLFHKAPRRSIAMSENPTLRNGVLARTPRPKIKAHVPDERWDDSGLPVSTIVTA